MFITPTSILSFEYATQLNIYLNQTFPWKIPAALHQNIPTKKEDKLIMDSNKLLYFFYI